jgi:hypothetical protein
MRYSRYTPGLTPAQRRKRDRMRRIVYIWTLAIILILALMASSIRIVHKDASTITVRGMAAANPERCTCIYGYSIRLHRWVLAKCFCRQAPVYVPVSTRTTNPYYIFPTETLEPYPWGTPEPAATGGSYP